MQNKISFEWNQSKARNNIIKHGVSFSEAKSVFFDDNARIIYDPGHSQHEDRFILLGLSNQLRMLVVSHCYRSHEGVVRIISARKAAPTEAKTYGENLP